MASRSVARHKGPSCRRPPGLPGPARVGLGASVRWRRGAAGALAAWAAAGPRLTVAVEAMARCGSSNRAPTTRALATPWKAGIRTAAFARPALDRTALKSSSATAMTRRSQTTQHASATIRTSVESETARTRPSRTERIPPRWTAGPWPAARRPIGTPTTSRVNPSSAPRPLAMRAARFTTTPPASHGHERLGLWPGRSPVATAAGRSRESASDGGTRR